jgi:hypothetical protein
MWRILFDKPWNIFPCRIHGLFQDEQWFIDSGHGFGQESRQHQHHVSICKHYC